MTFSLFTARVIGFWLLTILCTISAFAQTADQLEKELKSAVKAKNYSLAVTKANQLGLYYAGTKSYSKAISYYEQSLKYSRSANDEKSIYQAYRDIAQGYLSSNNTNKAIAALQESYKQAEIIDELNLKTESLTLLGQTQMQAHSYKEAISTWDKLLTIALENKSQVLQQQAYLQLAACNDVMGNKAKGNAYRELSNQITESKNASANEQKKITDLTKEVERTKKKVEIASTQIEESQRVLSAQAQQLKQTEDSLVKAEVRNRETMLKVELLDKDRELAESKFREQEYLAKQERQLRNGAGLIAILAIALVIIIVIDYRKKKATNKKIEQQNLAIKSSINYAKRIQEAMLPKSSNFKFAKDCFILFKPRDVVSGDFYWFSEMRFGDDDYSFAAVDCTGHGVPGAFMSMIGMKALGEIVARGIHQPSEILSSMHQEIRSALRQSETGNNDGMDVALCTYRKERNRLEFAGAKNPLVIIQNNELKQIKGDIHPIGGSKSKEQVAFKNHTIMIDSPTTLYLYSDGYRDQFGGVNNTKFMSKKFTRLLFEIHALPMAEQKVILEKRFTEWQGTHPQTDDVLVIGLKLEPDF